MRASWLEYRVPVSAGLLVLSLGSMFVLTSQSGSSFATYLLAIYTCLGIRRWLGLWTDWLFLSSCGLSVLIAASSFWSDTLDGRETFSQFVRAFLVITFVVAVAEGFRVDWFRAGVTRVVALLGGGAATLAIGLFVLEPPDDGRLKGVGQLDVHVRAALVFGVSATCAVSWLMESKRTLSRVLAASLLLVLLVAVALSGSRNAWVAVPLGIAVYVGACWFEQPRALLIASAIVICVGIAILGIALLQPELREWLLPRGDSFRIEIWTEIIRRWWDGGRWLGLGIQTTDDVVVGQYVMPHAHNLYLALLFQVGIVGLALFFWLVGLTLKTLWREYDRNEAKLALSILAIALPSYLLDGYRLVDKIGWSWMLFWLPLAVAVGLRSNRVLEDAQRFGRG